MTPTGTIEHLDPAIIVVETNLRSDTALPREFVDSIRQNGVLTPILARRTPDGTVIVRAGQRRTLAAREAGLATIPAYIVDADDSTVDRIVQQLVENDQRAAVTDPDRVAAYRQLTLEGLSPAAIAKRTGSRPATVTAGIAVAENPTAAHAISGHSLTLDQAAALIEFDGDDSTVADLVDVATSSPELFAHAAQRARDDRRIAAIRAAAAADLAARGYTVLDREPSYYDTTPVPLGDLISADGTPATTADIENADGRAAYVRVYYTSDEASISYYLADPTTAGLRKNTGRSTAGPMSDEQKAERRTLIANNKAWTSAETVRREWLTQLLGRKTLPKDAIRVIAQGLTVHHRDVGTAVGTGNTLAHTLLGIDRGSYWDADRLAAHLEHSPARAQHVALAVVLAGIEDSTSKNTWRYPDPGKAAYLTQLAAWGYTLSDVEHIVTDTDTDTGNESGTDGGTEPRAGTESAGTGASEPGDESTLTEE